MSLDGLFLSHLAKELNEELTGGRIQKISQLGKTEFLFGIRVNNQNKKLYISLSTSLARINLTSKNYPSDYLPGGFCMFLRKYVEGGFIRSITTLNHDRILEMELEGRNELGDMTTLYLIMEIFSRYTNLIILEDDRRVINAFKHVSPFDSAERTIANGIEYTLPEDERFDPDDFGSIKKYLSVERTHKDLVDNIKGISPIIAMHVAKVGNYKPEKVFEAYENTMTMPLKPTMYLGDKADFYHLDIFEKNQRYFDTLSDLLDHYYSEASSIERVKQIYKYLYGFVKREYKRKKTKLEKLSVDLANALNNDIWRIMGDTLIACQHQIRRGDSSFKGYAYELEKEVEIELDQLLDPIQNANKYYTKYKKRKVAVNHVNEQISITKRDIAYLDELMIQIQNTQSLSDLLEIQDDLIDNGFLPRKKREQSKKKPNYESYTDELGINILVGKNNIQNNYLTHKFAKKDYWWFHVKQQTGSHVIVCSQDELTEPTIRMAANLAALNSKSKASSSVAVDYTRVRYIKKVPGMIGSFVTYTNQKTIYIDPDIEKIEA